MDFLRGKNMVSDRFLYYSDADRLLDTTRSQVGEVEVSNTVSTRLLGYPVKELELGT